ncbi:AAA family ATPase [Psychrobacter immobilis]|uniref:AAA family ATPase n=1 Tax=Psychrobacter immobilis TaxID=498 RepID=UPI00191AC41B|nr:AAA family ATPase [Psychrobacter immobilis]
MKFIIENIGSIEKAEVELNNLSIICGENDSGKTTIAKVIYAVGQASSFFATDYQLKKYDKFRDIYDEMSFFVRKISNSDMSIEDSLSHLIERLQLTVLHLRRTTEVNITDVELVSSLIEEVKSLNVEKYFDEDCQVFFKRIFRLKDFLNEQYEKLEKEPIQDFIFEALKSEFSNDLLYKKRGIKRAGLTFYNEDEKIFSLKFNNKEVIECEILDKLPIKDSTLIDGSYVFQISQIIHKLSMMNTLRRRNNLELNLPYHVIDLCSKIDGSKNIKDEANSNYDWDSKDFYEGSIGFNTENRSFELFQEKKSYTANNVSSGMKSIAIVDLLYKGRFINRDSILIIDEPETNLHPKWQRLYAQAIVNLANQGTNILINTHSPYMLEALKIYSDKEKLKGTKFYFTSKEEEKIVVNDTNGNIIPIIEALSEPLYKLMEEQEDVSDF